MKVRVKSKGPNWDISNTRPELCRNYEVIKVSSSKHGFYARLERNPNNPEIINYCLFEGCAHLGGGDWEIVKEDNFFIRIWKKIVAYFK